MGSFTRLWLALATAALVVTPAAASAQERIDGQYIVVLKSGATVSKASGRAHARGGRVLRSFAHGIKGYTAKLSRGR